MDALADLAPGITPDRYELLHYINGVNHRLKKLNNSSSDEALSTEGSSDFSEDISTYIMDPTGTEWISAQAVVDFNDDDQNQLYVSRAQAALESPMLGLNIQTGSDYYTVRNGDTFYGIANRTFGGKFTVKQLMRWNPGIKAGSLQPGQRLRINPTPTVLTSEVVFNSLMNRQIEYYGQDILLGQTPYGGWLKEFYDFRYNSGERPVTLDFVHFKPPGTPPNIDHVMWRSWSFSRRAVAFDRFYPLRWVK